MNALLLPPYQNLIETILPHLKGTGRDYSSNLLVFPGKRPSHFVRKGLAQKVGGSVIPPVILSMDEFVDQVFEHQEGQPKRKLETIDAVAILYEIHKSAAKPFGREGFITPDRFFNIGLKIYRDIEEIAIEGVSLKRVKEADSLVREAIPERSLRRLQSLSFFYETFYQWIETSGFSTRSSRYRIVSERIAQADLTGYQQMIFAGFFALTFSEKGLFRKMSSWDNVLFVFRDGAGIKEKLSELGIEVGKEEDGESSPEISFYRSPDTHGQVFALSSILKKRIEKNIPLDQKNVIVLPSAETLFPLVRHALSLLGEQDYNISLGYPLQRTPIFGFLNNLMELVNSMDEDRVYVPDYLKFVLHPYTKNIYYNGNAEITRVVFHVIEEELTRSKTKTFLPLEEIENLEGLPKKVREKISEDETSITEEAMKGHLKNIHDHTIRRFLSFDNLCDFALKGIDLLTYIFSHSTACLHPLFYPFSESFILALDRVSKSLLQTIAFKERNSYFALLRRYLSTCYTPFEGTPLGGLQVLGVLETRNLSFESVFILDVNEEILPDTRKEDTLLPLKAREMLRLPTYVDRDKLITYYFETLIRGAKDVHLFFVENNEKEKSRFVEKLLWEKQKRERVTQNSGYIHNIQYRVNLENRAPAEIEKSDAILRWLRAQSYSATALDTYLGCPLSFYYGFVLKINKKGEVSGDLERADIGKFVHRALSTYFSRRIGYRLREADIDLREMASIVEDLFKKDFGENPSGAAYLLKKQINTHLSDFLMNYYLPLVRERAITVLGVEQDLRVTKNSFSLRGRCDQIETRDDKIFIIDYKTTANPDYLAIRFNKLDPDRRETWNEAIGSLQLPFYLLLYTEAIGGETKDLNTLFLLLGRMSLSRGIELPLFDHPGHNEVKYELLRRLIFDLLGEIVNPEVPFRPTPDRKALCASCDFKTICGMQWVVK